MGWGGGQGGGRVSARRAQPGQGPGGQGACPAGQEGPGRASHPRGRGELGLVLRAVGVLGGWDGKHRGQCPALPPAGLTSPSTLRLFLSVSPFLCLSFCLFPSLSLSLCCLSLRLRVSVVAPHLPLGTWSPLPPPPGSCSRPRPGPLADVRGQSKAFLFSPHGGGSESTCSPLSSSWPLDLPGEGFSREGGVEAGMRDCGAQERPVPRLCVYAVPAPQRPSVGAGRRDGLGVVGRG